MSLLILCCGVSASGKSTFAKELIQSNEWVEINRDNVRFETFCDGVHDWSKYKFTKQREATVTEICKQQFIDAVSKGLNIVVSDTNLNAKYHQYWNELCKQHNYEFELRYFDITLEEAWKRDERRSNSVGKDVITKQWQQWLEITNYARYYEDDNKLNCIVVDVDGTVAEKSADRSPYEWHKVHLDKPRRHVIDLINSYLHMYPSFELVIVSGRDGVCEQETRKWLLDNDILFDRLYMRKPGDQRKDTIIKEEILVNEIQPHYNIQLWFDDRPCVVRMLKDKHINVIDVSQTYQEF